VADTVEKMQVSVTDEDGMHGWPGWPTCMYLLCTLYTCLPCYITVNIDWIVTTEYTKALQNVERTNTPKYILSMHFHMFNIYIQYKKYSYIFEIFICTVYVIYVEYCYFLRKYITKYYLTVS